MPNTTKHRNSPAMMMEWLLHMVQSCDDLNEDTKLAMISAATPMVWSGLWRGDISQELVRLFGDAARKLNDLYL